MKIEFLNPFISSTIKNLEAMAQIQAKRGKMAIDKEGKSNVLSDGILLIIGITGDLIGRIIYNMSLETSLNIVSAMMFEEVTEFNADCKDALCELANIISGNSSTLLNNAGYKVDITTPTIIKAKEIDLDDFQQDKIINLIVNLDSDKGTVILNLALKEKNS